MRSFDCSILRLSVICLLPEFLSLGSAHAQVQSQTNVSLSSDYACVQRAGPFWDSGLCQTY